MKDIINENLWFEVASQMCDVLLALFGDDWVVSWIADNFTKKNKKSFMRNSDSNIRILG